MPWIPVKRFCKYAIFLQGLYKSPFLTVLHFVEGSCIFFALSCTTDSSFCGIILVCCKGGCVLERGETCVFCFFASLSLVTSLPFPMHIILASSPHLLLRLCWWVRGGAGGLFVLQELFVIKQKVPGGDKSTTGSDCSITNEGTVTVNNLLETQRQGI